MIRAEISSGAAETLVPGRADGDALAGEVDRFTEGSAVFELATSKACGGAAEAVATHDSAALFGR